MDHPSEIGYKTSIDGVINIGLSNRYKFSLKYPKKKDTAKIIKESPYIKSIIEVLSEIYHLINFKAKMIRKIEPIIAIILFVINKFIVEYLENNRIDTITILRFAINISFITLLINNKLDKYFDLEMIFTLSLQTKLLEP